MFASRFCNIYITAIFKKKKPMLVFCKYFFPCQTKSYFYLTIKALAKMLLKDISSHATILSYDC